jgi:hypothetical protein
MRLVNNKLKDWARKRCLILSAPQRLTARQKHGKANSRLAALRPRFTAGLPKMKQDCHPFVCDIRIVVMQVSELLNWLSENWLEGFIFSKSCSNHKTSFHTDLFVFLLYIGERRALYRYISSWIKFQKHSLDIMCLLQKLIYNTDKMYRSKKYSSVCTLL